MIIITRKKGEGIVINDNIIVSVVEVRSDKVRLGVEHPVDVSVEGPEDFDAVCQENERSQRPR